MTDAVDAILTAYDRRARSRREVLAALAALAPAAAAAQPASTLRARTLHHVNLQVADVARSEAFYRRVFGFGPTRPLQGNAHGFDLAQGIVSLQQGQRAGVLDHFCLGVEGYDTAGVTATLKAAGVDVRGGGADSVFFTDPDGIRVQLSAVDWRA